MLGWRYPNHNIYVPTRDPPGSSVDALRVSPGALLGETPRPLRVRPSGFARCSTWGDPKTALAYQLLYLGRPQDRTRIPHWLTTCSTWGDPKTALAYHLLHLGRPQDRSKIRAVAPLLGVSPRPHWLTFSAKVTCSQSDRYFLSI